VDDGRAAADPLDPDVLDAWNVISYVALGDDQPGLEGLVDPIACSVEVGLKDDCAVAGGRGLLSFGRGAGALETGTRQEHFRIPADTFAGQAAIQRHIPRYSLGAAEAASRVNEFRVEVERAAAGEGDGTGGKAADLAGVEAEAGLALARCQCRGGEGEEQPPSLAVVLRDIGSSFWV